MLRKFVIVLLATIAVSFGGLVAFMYAAPEAFTRVVIDAGRSNAKLERKEIVRTDGLRYVYLEGGQGEPRLLLLG